MQIKTINNISIPAPGFGTCGLGNDDESVKKIVLAAKCGYRHFDTAPAYNNEKIIGEALKIIFKEVCDRKEIFVAGKVSNEDLTNVTDGYEATIKAFNRTVEKLCVDYLDLFLIHWPVPRYAEKTWKSLNKATWHAMEDLYNQGKIKVIGVSNFEERHLDNICEDCRIKPMVNQIEVQPFYQQLNLIKFCQSHDILVEAWGPLKQGEVFKIKELNALAEKYKKTISQICLRFCLQVGTLPIVKSSDKTRMNENMDIFSWNISNEDMKIIYALNSLQGRFKNYAYTRRDEC